MLSYLRRHVWLRSFYQHLKLLMHILIFSSPQIRSQHKQTCDWFISIDNEYINPISQQAGERWGQPSQCCTNYLCICHYQLYQSVHQKQTTFFSIAQKCLCTQTHAQVSNQLTNRRCISKGYRETGKLAVKIFKCLNIQVQFLCCVCMWVIAQLMGTPPTHTRAHTLAHTHSRKHTPATYG